MILTFGEIPNRDDREIVLFNEHGEMQYSDMFNVVGSEILIQAKYAHLFRVSEISEKLSPQN